MTDEIGERIYQIMEIVRQMAIESSQDTSEQQTKFIKLVNRVSQDIKDWEYLMRRNTKGWITNS